MIRRFSFFLILCLLLVSFSHNLIAQVFPDREELDVVRLVDGTVLKGVILEEVPERYLEIQLYGGSTFVLGYEQIESVERETNPDYGTTWIKVDLGDLDAAAAGTTAVSDAGPRPLSAGGHLVSVYSYGMIPELLGLSVRMGGFSAEDWDGDLPDTDNDIEDPNLQYGDRTVHGGLGLAYTWWTPFEQTERTPWIWGVRGSTGYHGTYSGLQERNRSTEPRDIELDVEAHFVPVFADGLIGIAGDRAALVGGLGLGLGITYLRTEYGYGLDYSDGTSVDNREEELTVRHPITPLYSASLTGLFRLGRRWVLEAGLWANGQFVSTFEEGFVFRGWGERIAIGYRFGGK